MTTYDLWDIETGNVIGEFDTEAEALRIVGQLLESNGVDYVEALDLGTLDDQGDGESSATGRALLERLRAAAPEYAALVDTEAGRS